MQRLFNNNAWITVRRGTRDQARDYCMKDDTRMDGDPATVVGPFEYGDWRLGGAGTRTDLLAVTDRISAGATESDIASEFPVSYMKYSRGITRLINLHPQPRNQPPEIILCYGPTGTGKTKYCWDTHPLLYVKPCDTRWFDRYQGHEVLLLDDFGGRTSKMSLLYLLQLLDRYPLLVEGKGTYMSMVATTILITTNSHPFSWYDYSNREESYAALQRRVHKVLYFGAFGVPPVNCAMDIFFEGYTPGQTADQFCVEMEEETQETEENQSVDEDSDDSHGVHRESDDDDDDFCDPLEGDDCAGAVFDAVMKTGRNTSFVPPRHVKHVRAHGSVNKD